MRKTEKIDGVEYEILYHSVGSVPSTPGGISWAGVVLMIVLALVITFGLGGLLNIVLTTVR